MTRRPSRRDITDRVVDLESDGGDGRILGWQDLMDYSIDAVEAAENGDELTMDEYFEGDWQLPDWWWELDPPNDLDMPGDTEQSEAS